MFKRFWKWVGGKGGRGGGDDGVSGGDDRATEMKTKQRWTIARENRWVESASLGFKLYICIDVEHIFCGTMNGEKQAGRQSGRLASMYSSDTLCINISLNIQRYLSVKQTWQLYFMVL